jgi:hypothetical protein
MVNWSGTVMVLCYTVEAEQVKQRLTIQLHSADCNPVVLDITSVLVSSPITRAVFELSKNNGVYFGGATVCHSIRDTPSQHLRKELEVKPPTPRQFKH